MPAIAAPAPYPRRLSPDATAVISVVAYAGRPRPRPARRTARCPVQTEMPAGEPDRPSARSTYVAEPQPADSVLGSIHDQAAADASQAITDLYHSEYRSLVRMSAVLVGDVSTAEEVVQDTFIAMHSAWRRLRQSDKAVNYLRRSVMNRSRSVLRHRAVADRHAPKPEPDMPSAEQGAIAQLERSAVISALLALPPRQREALVLKFYLDLSEGQVASMMHISRGAVKSHTARAKAAMRTVLEPRM
jgi:RNA polymerase sigma-70 factor (sigma-E family)